MLGPHPTQNSWLELSSGPAQRARSHLSQPRSRWSPWQLCAGTFSDGPGDPTLFFTDIPPHPVLLLISLSSARPDPEGKGWKALTDALAFGELGWGPQTPPRLPFLPRTYAH